MGNHSSLLALASFAALAAAQDAADAPAAPRGCVWDQTGCTQGCDTSLMETRCQRMNHDKDACLGDEGKLSRCMWSHGEADLATDDAADELSSLGCIWDLTGCKQGCNVEAMMGRCSVYNHDMDSCLGDDGQEARCKWGKYSDRMIDNLEKLKLANAEQEQEQEQPAEIDDDDENENETEVIAEDDQEAVEEEELEDEDDVLAETFVDDEATVDDEDEFEEEEEEELEDEDDVLAETFVDDDEALVDDADEFEEGEDEDEDDVLAETFVGDETEGEQDEPVIDNFDCIWDETGCVGGKCAEVMGSRCSALSMMECVGDLGAFKRCKQREVRQSATLFGLNVNVFDYEASTVDTFLVISGVLTSLVVLQQAIKHCKQRTNKQLVAREIQYGTIQLIDSHAEEAHV